MGSLHSFDRALDKFMAWLSDAESSLESLEIELDSYGPGVKTSRERTIMQLKVGTIHLAWFAREVALVARRAAFNHGARNNRNASKITLA